MSQGAFTVAVVIVAFGICAFLVLAGVALILAAQ